MVWSHNDSWMVTGDHGGYVKYWQSNMNNVRMFQAHKEPVRGIRYDISNIINLIKYTNYLLLLLLLFIVILIIVLAHRITSLRLAVMMVHYVFGTFFDVKKNAFSVGTVQMLNVFIGIHKKH